MSHRSQIYLTTSEPQQAGAEADLTFSGRKTWKVSATREKRPFYLKARSPTAPPCRQRRAGYAGQGWITAPRLTPEPAATAGSCPRRAEPRRPGDTPGRRQREKRPSPMPGSTRTRRRQLLRVPRQAEPGPGSPDRRIPALRPSLPLPGRDPPPASPAAAGTHHPACAAAASASAWREAAACGSASLRRDGASWRRGGTRDPGSRGLRSPGKHGNVPGLRRDLPCAGLS